MLTNREIVIEERAGVQRPVAAFDLTAADVAAVADALEFYRRRRFQGAELDADSALAMYAATAVADQASALAREESDATLRLERGGVGVLGEAVNLYLAERDVDSYQSPEERARIDRLRALVDPLLDLAIDLRGAERELRSRSIAR